MGISYTQTDTITAEVGIPLTFLKVNVFELVVDIGLACCVQWE